MKTEYSFRVAGFLFTLCLPEEQNVKSLLPSFTPFFCQKEYKKERLFNFETSSEPLPITTENGVQIEETYNDMGFIRLLRLPDNTYRIEIRHLEESPIHYAHVLPDFSSAVATIYWNDPYAGHVLCSLLRIIYSQALLSHHAVSVHASSVCFEGKAYLFMGKSGTGKSTHSELWMKYLPDCELLNDDNPTLKLIGEKLFAYGTPWSGKTACYKDICFPVGGIVRLRQAETNRFFIRKDIEAFSSLLAACLCVSSDMRLHAALCDFLVQISDKVPIGELECLPDREALSVCMNGLGLFKETKMII